MTTYEMLVGGGAAALGLTQVVMLVFTGIDRWKAYNMAKAQELAVALAGNSSDADMEQSSKGLGASAAPLRPIRGANRP